MQQCELGLDRLVCLPVTLCRSIVLMLIRTPENDSIVDTLVSHEGWACLFRRVCFNVGFCSWPSLADDLTRAAWLWQIPLQNGSSFSNRTSSILSNKPLTMHSAWRPSEMHPVVEVAQLNFQSHHHSSRDSFGGKLPQKRPRLVNRHKCILQIHPDVLDSESRYGLNHISLLLWSRHAVTGMNMSYSTSETLDVYFVDALS